MNPRASYAHLEDFRFGSESRVRRPARMGLGFPRYIPAGPSQSLECFSSGYLQNGPSLYFTESRDPLDSITTRRARGRRVVVVRVSAARSSGLWRWDGWLMSQPSPCACPIPCTGCCCARLPGATQQQPAPISFLSVVIVCLERSGKCGSPGQPFYCILLPCVRTMHARTVFHPTGCLFRWNLCPCFSTSGGAKMPEGSSINFQTAMLWTTCFSKMVGIAGSCYAFAAAAYVPCNTAVAWYCPSWPTGLMSLRLVLWVPRLLPRRHPIISAAKWACSLCHRPGVLQEHHAAMRRVRRHLRQQCRPKGQWPMSAVIRISSMVSARSWMVPRQSHSRRLLL
ncbi:hypothetical protein K431DRAFT_94505 [Polychaeton citri CBS 116435]|uniref:Uncharacterized protein n=1 Tax=Polychaeton citri CBS 116435 TaxID=1314669 RepID=A0A9P4UNY6_9PEZI|nr:hypothetical protein K431DRAFT_94505 [Polychaeton citri CBS 116435]